MNLIESDLEGLKLMHEFKKNILNYWVEKKYGFKCFRNNCFNWRDFAVSNIKVGCNIEISDSKIEGKITIGSGTQINNSIVTGEVEVGRHTSINGPTSFVVAKHHSIKIGNYTSIAHNVSIVEFFHNTYGFSTSFLNKKITGKPSSLDTYSKGDIEIGSDVWIGAGAVILSGVKIGNGAVIGANSVVTKDVPDYAVAAGNPTEVLKYRFEQEIIESLLSLGWYNYDISDIKKVRNIMNQPVTYHAIEELLEMLTGEKKTASIEGGLQT